MPENSPILVEVKSYMLANPGRGGVVAVLNYQGRAKMVKTNYALTTNNRLDLMGCILALERIKPYNTPPIVIRLENQYIYDAITKGWLENWKKRYFIRKKNKDLWLWMAFLIERMSPTFEILPHGGLIKWEGDAKAIANTPPYMKDTRYKP